MRLTLQDFGRAGADPQNRGRLPDAAEGEESGVDPHGAARSVVAEAAKAGMPVQAVLTTCCARGWVGFKAEWAANQARAGHQTRQTIDEQRKATLRRTHRTKPKCSRKPQHHRHHRRTSSALPEPWIERLFARFEAMYGARFADAWKWGLQHRPSSKAVWAEDLGVQQDECRWHRKDAGPGLAAVVRRVHATLPAADRPPGRTASKPSSRWPSRVRP